MVQRVFDVYAILGFAVSIAALLIDKLLPNKIPLSYTLLGIEIFTALMVFIIQVTFMLSKFSEVSLEFDNIRKDIQKSNQEISLIRSLAYILSSSAEIR